MAEIFGLSGDHKEQLRGVARRAPVQKHFGDFNWGPRDADAASGVDAGVILESIRRHSRRAEMIAFVLNALPDYANPVPPWQYFLDGLPQ